MAVDAAFGKDPQYVPVHEDLPRPAQTLDIAAIPAYRNAMAEIQQRAHPFFVVILLGHQKGDETVIAGDEE